MIYILYNLYTFLSRFLNNLDKLQTTFGEFIIYNWDLYPRWCQTLWSKQNFILKHWRSLSSASPFLWRWQHYRVKLTGLQLMFISYNPRSSYYASSYPASSSDTSSFPLHWRIACWDGTCDLHLRPRTRSSLKETQVSYDGWMGKIAIGFHHLYDTRGCYFLQRCLCDSYEKRPHGRCETWEATPPRLHTLTLAE